MFAYAEAGKKGSSKAAMLVPRRPSGYSTASSSGSSKRGPWGYLHPRSEQNAVSGAAQSTATSRSGS